MKNRTITANSDAWPNGGLEINLTCMDLFIHFECYLTGTNY